jgi:hypothetical protein
MSLLSAAALMCASPVFAKDHKNKRTLKVDFGDGKGEQACHVEHKPKEKVGGKENVEHTMDCGEHKGCNGLSKQSLAGDTNGDWHMECADGFTATGTFKHDDKADTVEGTGKGKDKAGKEFNISFKE